LSRPGTCGESYSSCITPNQQGRHHSSANVKSNIPGTYACNSFTLQYLTVLNGATVCNTYMLPSFHICCQMNGLVEYPVQWNPNFSLFFKLFIFVFMLSLHTHTNAVIHNTAFFKQCKQRLTE
jgi:hypothetical protein